MYPNYKLNVKKLVRNFSAIMILAFVNAKRRFIDTL